LAQAIMAKESLSQNPVFYLYLPRIHLGWKDLTGSSYTASASRQQLHL